MKVILTQEVEKLGGTHQVVEVADGYARNYLLPRSLALPATKSALAGLNNLKRVDERRQNRLRGAAEAQAGQLNGKTVVIAARAGTAGRLYGSVSAADIARQVQQDLGIEVDRKHVLLDEAIRSTGVYPVSVALHRDVQVQIMVQVGDAPAEPAAPDATANAENSAQVNA